LERSEKSVRSELVQKLRREAESNGGKERIAREIEGGPSAGHPGEARAHAPGRSGRLFASLGNPAMKRRWRSSGILSAATRASLKGVIFDKAQNAGKRAHFFSRPQ
jgi:hypothetical protein